MLDTNLLKEIISIPSPSGYEKYIKNYLMNYSKKNFKKTTAFMNGGEVYFIKKADKNPELAKNILFDAHIDHVSLRIMTITNEGFLICRSFGLNDEDTYGKSVNILTKNGIIKGVIAINPPHLNIKNKQIIVDIFVSSKQEAESQVQIGDSIFFEPNVQIINNFVNGTGLDNHVGVFTLVSLAKKIDKLPLDYNIFFHFSSREETGGLKFISLSRMVKEIPNKIDLIFVVDTDLANDSYTLRTDDIPDTALRKGPIITRNISDDADVFDFLMKILGNLPHQITMSDGDGGNNLLEYNKLNAIGQSIGIPLRYMHSSVETCHLDDIILTIELLVRIIKNLHLIQL
jgi:putative aminopeptidase FrvX